MEYAIDKRTGRLESAVKGSKFKQYICPVCKKMVSHRTGRVKRSHFAHLPGWGTIECENFVPSQHSQHTYGQVTHNSIIVKQSMELRLLIPSKGGFNGWSIQLMLPECQICRARVTLDLGGRTQTLDMRSMVKRRQVAVELSTKPYRIISFSGTPDPLFLAGVERECPGLPSFGAAVFTASGNSEIFGFPRAKTLRSFETFALLWRNPTQPDFPDELVINRLCDRQGWHLALVTLPEPLSSKCSSWLQSFTNLPIAQPKSSIIPVWPFLTRNTSVNEIECSHSDIVLLSADRMPIELNESGPTMYAKSAYSTFSAVGVEKSPAFFALNPDWNDSVGISEVSNQDLKVFLNFFPRIERVNKLPSVELAFLTSEGNRHIVPLHQRKCTEFAKKLRAIGIGIELEYLSMPQGAKGILRVEGMFEKNEIKLYSSNDTPLHNQHMRLLSPDLLAQLTLFLSDSRCQVEIEFYGFGRLNLPIASANVMSEKKGSELSSALRSRLLSFIFQLRLSSSIVAQIDDISLVEVLACIRPEPRLIPHYRSLVKEILASGFELKFFR